MEPAVDGGKPRRRDYEKILSTLENRWKRRPAERGRIMQEVIDALWDAFGGKIYSWCGFYTTGPGANLVLGPHRDKPACASIGMHGVCGRAASERKTQVIADVKSLGDAHIECDPSNRAEIAVPIIDSNGTVFAVLDVDSTQVGAFGEEDRRWLERIVRTLSQTAVPERRD